MEWLMPNEDSKYTKSDMKIMEFIENNTDEFVFMSIGQLAKRLDMSEATISRFVRHIGYSDYKEMKSYVVAKKVGKGPARKIAGTLMKNQGFDIPKWFHYQQECLERTQSQIDFKELDKAITAIQKARRIYIHAKNASASTGQLLFFRLRRLGYDVSLIPSGGSEIIEGIAHAGEGDLVIIFSYSKISSEGRIILDYAQTAGYQTMAFTSRLYAPSDQRADINIYVYRGEKEEYHSMTAAVAMIDAIVLALSEKMSSKSAENLRKVQNLKKLYSK